MMLIGLTGFKGSGKNTVGDYLEEKYDFVQKSFAAKLKKSSAALFAVPEYIWETFKNDPNATVELNLSGMNRRIITVREFLQRYGTEAHRDIFGYDFWVDQVLPPRAKPVLNVPRGRTVITDVRFDNELKRVKDYSGIIINIVRPGANSENHASEQPIPADMIDFTITNDKTIEDLHKSVDEVLIKVFLNAVS